MMVKTKKKNSKIFYNKCTISIGWWHIFLKYLRQIKAERFSSPAAIANLLKRYNNHEGVIDLNFYHRVKYKAISLCRSYSLGVLQKHWCKFKVFSAWMNLNGFQIKTQKCERTKNIGQKFVSILFEFNHLRWDRSTNFPHLFTSPLEGATRREWWIKERDRRI